MRDYAFPVQGLGRVPVSSDRAFPTGVGLSVQPPGGTKLFSSTKPIPCPSGFSWVNAYPPDPSSPIVYGLTKPLVEWIRSWAAKYPSSAAPDGAFYFHLGTPTGMPLMFSPGFGNVSVCAKRQVSSTSGSLRPTIVAGAPPSAVLTNPAALASILATRGAPTQVQPTSYTWLYVLLGLGAAGVAGYYLLD